VARNGRSGMRILHRHTHKVAALERGLESAVSECAMRKKEEGKKHDEGLSGQKMKNTHRHTHTFACEYDDKTLNE